METVEETLKPGDWVEIVDHHLAGYSGFILRYSIAENTYKVKITKDSKGKQLLKALWFDVDQVVTVHHSTDEEDIMSLVELALQTNDKEWFMELTAQLPKTF